MASAINTVKRIDELEHHDRRNTEQIKLTMKDLNEVVQRLGKLEQKVKEQGSYARAIKAMMETLK